MGEHELQFTEDLWKANERWFRGGPEEKGGSCPGGATHTPHSHDEEFWQQFDHIELQVEPPDGIVKAVDSYNRNGPPLWTIKVSIIVVVGIAQAVR